MRWPGLSGSKFVNVTPDEEDDDDDDDDDEVKPDQPRLVKIHSFPSSALIKLSHISVTLQNHTKSLSPPRARKVGPLR